jgi:signal peptidase I
MSKVPQIATDQIATDLVVTDLVATDMDYPQSAGGASSGLVLAPPDSIQESPAAAFAVSTANHNPAQAPKRPPRPEIVHGPPEAITWMLRTIIGALFVVTFLAQPMVIPSESMERTLLVGDFLLMNRSALAPAGAWRRILPYDPVQRGEIVTFRSPINTREYLIKRVIGLPGDRLRIDNGQVVINGSPLEEPYVAFEPTPANPYLEHFPTSNYTDSRVEPNWWKQLQADTKNGELVIPQDAYFMLGDNRNNSRDSRYWGFVNRSEIVARPLVIYFSLTRPSHTDVQQASDDRLGHESDVSAHLKGFARWKRIFHVVH